ncbi:MAG TPA: phosphate ABC transporter permease subunit PstC [Euryarchaeota archaeon]|nr:phosphate transport system permease protein PstC [archaeon BMS3Bbin15]HDL14640.1 phosphate ABC transporter permease subunit PstC [Euryarchaeota archaeon]
MRFPNFFFSFRKSEGQDRIFQFFMGTVTLISVIFLALILLYELIKGSMPSIQHFGYDFIFSTAWNPVKNEFGALPFIFGTFVSSFLALLIGVPICLGIAVYVTEIASPRISALISPLIELLAAIPSVIIGLWGIFVFAPFVRDYISHFLVKYLGFLPLFEGPDYGLSMLTAGMVLAIMIIPIVSSVSREALLAVPILQKEAALALGATRFEAMIQVILPYARGAIFGAVILGLGRAIGETMAVTMVIGNRPEISASILHPGYTMAAVIANEFTEATANIYLATLIEIGLILFIISIIVNAIARFINWKYLRIQEN